MLSREYWVMRIKTIPAEERSYHHGNLFSALLDSAEEELIERGIEGFSLRGVAGDLLLAEEGGLHDTGEQW